MSEFHEQSNKSIIKRFYSEVVNAGDFSLFSTMVKPDFIDNSTMPGQGEGAEGLMKGVSSVRGSFPDISFTVDDMVSEGERVVARWTMKGTHMGEYLGIQPTQRKVVVSGMEVFRMSKFKLKERWQCLDAVGFMKQLGVAQSDFASLFLT